MMNDKMEMCCDENNNSDVIMKAVISFLAIFMPSRWLSAGSIHKD